MWRLFTAVGPPNVFTRHVCISIAALKGGLEKNLKAFLK